jgi:type VI secretion system protein ImpF
MGAAVATTNYETGTTPSLLERLLDGDPASPYDPPGVRVHGVAEMQAAVQRDVEHLLNTRNPHGDLSSDFDEAGQSVLTYGLADCSTLNMSSAADQARLRQLVEHAIRSFEPRLAGVSATLLPVSATDRSLRMRIEARLLVEPSPEPVSFDVTMPLTTSRSKVSEGG